MKTYNHEKIEKKWQKTWSANDYFQAKDLDKKIPKLLDTIHNNLFKKAEKSIKDNIVVATDWGDVIKAIRNKKLVKMPFCGESECEDWIKEKTGGASSRCIPFEENTKKTDKCLHCKKPAKQMTYFSKSY